MTENTKNMDVDNERTQVIDDGDEGKNEGPFKRPTRKRKSHIWPHVEIIKVNGIEKAKCIYCKKLLSLQESKATSHIARHLKGCTRKQLADKKQKMLNFQPEESKVVVPIMSTGKYCQAKQLPIGFLQMKSLSTLWKTQPSISCIVQTIPCMKKIPHI
ncbi:hypothetical protein OROHE_025638 [Orobanche hederae]